MGDWSGLAGRENGPYVDFLVRPFTSQLRRGRGWFSKPTTAWPYRGKKIGLQRRGAPKIERVVPGTAANATPPPLAFGPIPLLWK